MVCNSVKCAQGAHFGRLSKIVFRVLAAMPTVGEIGSANLCSCKFIKENQQRKLFDKHGLDAGLSRLGNKIHQGCRLTKTRVVADIGSAKIGSLYADANSTACNSLCK